MPQKLIFLLGLIVLQFSCVKDIDISQADELHATTPISFSLVSIELEQRDFIDRFGMEITEIQDESTVRISDFVSRSVNNQVIIDVLVNNNIDRDFSIILDFLNEDGNLLFTKNIEINALSLNQQFQIIIADNEFELFLNFDKLVSHLILHNGSTPLDPLQDRSIYLQSSMSFEYAY